ncbi:MAG: GDSL-type esterase/lipase family protein, partial [Lentisphaerae bacterium]|nr:GDSL-type esterase/lipase family protein [Lentisphaerota bacterium]
LYDAASGYWRIKLSGLNHEEQVLAWGGPGWLPVPADYDGDGITDPALYHEMLGKWIVMFSGEGYQPVQADFGGPWQQPVPADYDGDGLADPALYHRTLGVWTVMMSGSGYLPATAICGGPGWQPAPADYDGDGLADPVVRNVATGQWYARMSNDGYQPATSELGPAGTAWRLIPSIYQAPFKFLAFGDSITYGSGSSGQGPATGYPIRVERWLNEVYGSHFISINAGISGESSSAGRRRFAAVLEQQAPRLVLLMEGTNDLGAGNDFNQLESNLRSMVQMAQDRGVYVVLATIPPVISNIYKDRSVQQARIVQFNPRIPRIASDSGIPVARVYEAITGVPGWQTSLMEQESANHPNDTGYNYVRDAFYRVLADALDQGIYY